MPSKYAIQRGRMASKSISPSTKLGSQHPSPNVKILCNFEPNFWPEIITSRDAESTCFKASRTSREVINVGIFGPNFGRKRSHHVMDASCRKNQGNFTDFCGIRPLTFTPYELILLGIEGGLRNIEAQIWTSSVGPVCCLIVLRAAAVGRRRVWSMSF